MARSHPPLPSITTPLIWFLRVTGLLIFMGALYVAFLAGHVGRWDTAVLALAVGGGFAVMTWLHPLNPWFAALLGSVGLLTALMTQTWISALFFGAIAGGLLWWPRRARRPGAVRVRVDRIAEADPNAVMKGAKPWVAEFDEHGYHQVGAIVIPTGPLRVVESLLISEDGLSYAAVTDAVLHVTSLFPDGRALVTRNNDLGAQPPWVLVDNLPGGSPAELIESHRRALALVAERDHYPIALSAPELPAIAIESERSTVEWARATRGGRSATVPRGQLWNRLGRYDEIGAWHGGRPSDDDHAS